MKNAKLGILIMNEIGGFCSIKREKRERMTGINDLQVLLGSSIALVRRHLFKQNRSYGWELRKHSEATD